MKIRLAIPALAVLLATPAAWAQAGAAHAADSSAKIGIIDMQAAIANTAEGKQGLAELQTKFAPRKADLQDLQKQMDDLQAHARAVANTASDEENANIQQKYSQLSRTLQRKTQEAQDDYTEATQEVASGVLQKMTDILSKYAKDNGYVVILDASSQQTPVIYAAPQANVTQDIVRLYDQAHPVKAAAAAPKPSTPKPAPKPQPKP